MSENQIDDTIQLLLSKYDGLDNLDKSTYSKFTKSKSSKVSQTDMTRIGILTRENEKLKEIVESQKEVMELFEERFQDLSIVYNTKIEKLRDRHDQEMNELHQQFKTRLKKEIDNNSKQK